VADSLLPTVSLGLGIGIAFIVIFSVGFSKAIPEDPIMILKTADGKSFRASINSYCHGACDLFAYARIIPPDPPVQIDRELGATFRITNSIEQPQTIRFYLPNYELGLTVGFEEAREDGKYTIDLDPGQYILDVVAIWDDSEDEDRRTSLHRFKVIIK
jgi:hypothetical protein